MKWEYKTIKLAHDSFFVNQSPGFESVEMDKFINQFGEKGWELVSAVGVPTKMDVQWTDYDFDNVIILFFKRPLAE